MLSEVKTWFTVEAILILVLLRIAQSDLNSKHTKQIKITPFTYLMLCSYINSNLDCLIFLTQNLKQWYLCKEHKKKPHQCDPWKEINWWIRLQYTDAPWKTQLIDWKVKIRLRQKKKSPNLFLIKCCIIGWGKWAQRNVLHGSSELQIRAAMRQW